MSLEDLKHDNLELTSKLIACYGEERAEAFLNDVITYSCAYRIEPKILLQKLSIGVNNLDDIIFCFRDTLSVAEWLGLDLEQTLEELFSRLAQSSLEERKVVGLPAQSAQELQALKSLYEYEFDCFIETFGIFDGIKYFLQLTKYSSDHNRDVARDLSLFVDACQTGLAPEDTLEAFRHPGYLEQLEARYSPSAESQEAYNADTAPPSPNADLLGDAPGD